MAKKASIIGGYGGMGQIFAKFFKKEGFEVTIAGPTERKGIKATEELGVEYSRDNVKAVENADVVMVSVPIDKTLDVIKEVGPHIKEGALFMDDTSIKKNPCKAMQESSNEKVEVVGSHPVFGPRVGTVDGQTFVLTPVRGKKWFNWIHQKLLEHKARVVVSTPEEHDRIMAVVQGLTHFTYISTGKTLQELGVNIKKSKQFSSPVYELMLDMIGRIIGQDPKLYAEIQMQNPEVPKVHKNFIEVAGKLSKIVEDKDEKKFVQLMVESAKHFGDVDRSMGRSDKAISSLVSELETLKNSVGKELCVKHIYSGKKHLGVVKTVTPDEVTLDDNGKEFTLKLSNIQVMDNSERIKFKAERFDRVSRDFSVLLDEGADEEFISGLLADNNEDILSIKIKDVYKGEKLGKERKSICFTIEIINTNIKETEKEIAEFFEKIGGKIR